MMKRVITLLLIGLLVLSCAAFVACAGESTKKDDNKTETTAAATQETAKPQDTKTPAGEDTKTPDQPTETPVDTKTPVEPTTPDQQTETPVDTKTPVEPTTPTEDEDEIPECPPVNTPAWADWLSLYGAESDDYADLEMLSSSFYSTRYKDPDGTEHDATPWENWGDPKHFQFLITFDCTEFEINFNSSVETSPYTWHIWYKDADTDDEWKECITKPWSLYDWGNGSYIFRTPTYLGGMDTLHTDDGAPNQYEFIIAIFDDEDDSLVCWHDCFPDVTDSYEL